LDFHLFQRLERLRSELLMTPLALNAAPQR
jgi:hypothetical protein